MTLDGSKPKYKELYNIVEHSSAKYPPRTFANVKSADKTLRFAGNWSSAGEICTLKAIKYYDKRHLDIDFYSPLGYNVVREFLYDVKILNIAWNSEKTFAGIYDFTKNYLLELLS